MIQHLHMQTRTEGVRREEARAGEQRRDSGRSHQEGQEKPESASPHHQAQFPPAQEANSLLDNCKSL